MPSRICLPQSVDMALVDPEFSETCFFTDDEEEFYEDSRLNKNLFKKFELHTPPQSPPHNPFPPDQTADSVDTCLKMTSKALEIGYEQSMPLASLDVKALIIQDCMWSEPCLAAAGLISPNQKKLSSRSSSNCVKTPSSPSVNSCSSMSQTMDINSDDCVSPAAVFPYPINELEKQKSVETTHFNLGSVAETPSPSESEDEEEIDVVTVVAEKMARRRQCPNSIVLSPASVTSFKSHVASIHNYSNTSSPPASFSAPQSPQTNNSHREASLFSSQHGSHKRSRPMSMPASPQPAKKSRSLLHSTTDLKRLKCVAEKLSLGHQSNMSTLHVLSSNSSRNSSDSEEGDTNKRAQHNVLERKRRNDLKYSFLKLRDNVPELANQERSPKVTILKLSADYLRKLTHKHKVLDSELERTKFRYEQMKSKLMALRRECL